MLIAFISGMIVGVAGDRVMLFLRHSYFPQRVSRHMTDRILGRLDHELHLTAEQKKQVEEILERHRNRIDSIWSGVRTQVRGEIDQGNAEIEKILTPEQREKFVKMRMRLRGPGHGHEMPARHP
jgi:Spy/CpxP family protein refolding chaperone